MNYKRIHDDIIMDALVSPPTGYVERHHIVPRCMGGTDDSWNLVTLSARQHFIVHWLLTKIYPNVQGLIYAFHMMFHPTSAGTSETDWTATRSRVYARLKERMVEDIHRRFREDGHPRQGTKHTPETIAKMKETLKTRKRSWTPEQREAHGKLRLGSKQTDKQKDAVRNALAKTWRVTTPKGETLIITNLRQFCLEHGLNQGNLSTYGQTKGYTATKLEKEQSQGF